MNEFTQKTAYSELAKKYYQLYQYPIISIDNGIEQRIIG